MMKKNQRKKRMSVRVVDRLLLVVLMIVFVSGILLHPFSEMLAVKMIHKLSSVLLVIGVIVHMVQHKRGKGV